MVASLGGLDEAGIPKVTGVVGCILYHFKPLFSYLVCLEIYVHRSVYSLGWMSVNAIVNSNKYSISLPQKRAR